MRMPFTRKLPKLSRLAGALALLCSVAAASWLTFGGDSQRDGWAREETEITPQSVKGMHMLWKLKLDNQPVQLNSLTLAGGDQPRLYKSRRRDLYRGRR